VQEVAVDTSVVAWLQVPLETFANGPPEEVLRTTKYPPCAGKPDAAPQDSVRLVVVGFDALPTPGALSVTACACPVPPPGVVL
jgi:hypothetical protein